MGAISLTRTTPGAVSDANANLNNNWTALENLLNGGLDASNLAADSVGSSEIAANARYDRGAPGRRRDAGEAGRQLGRLLQDRGRVRGERGAGRVRGGQREGRGWGGDRLLEARARGLDRQRRRRGRG